MITPVQLGCSTLVRIKGELTETTAGQAISSLLHVLDQTPHTILIDLALLTGLDRPAPARSPSPPAVRRTPRSP